MSAIYDPDAAVEYARLFWDKACSDGFICLDPATAPRCTGKPKGDPYIAVPSGTKFVVSPGPPATEEVITPAGSKLKLGPGCLDDAAHFVSCCIGTPPAPSSGLAGGAGGLKLTSSPRFPKAPYGVTGPKELADQLRKLVRPLMDKSGDRSLPCGVRKGDVILYYRGGRYTHAAIFVSGKSIATHSISRSPAGTLIPSEWDYVVALDPAYRWSIYHLPTPPRTFAVTIGPFPAKAALECDSKPAGPLQSRVDLSTKLTVAAAEKIKAKSAGTLAASLIDLTGDPAKPPQAGYRETETFYIGSMAKVFAMFAAFGLRNRTRRTAEAAVSSGLDPANPGFARSVTGAVEDAWKTPVAKGFAKLDTSFPRQFPKLRLVFDFGCLASGEYAEFKSGIRAGKVTSADVDEVGEFGRPTPGMAFQEWLDLTIRWSNNWAADLVITALGYPYINGVLREAGFQSDKNPLVGPLFIAGSYRNKYLHDDWGGKDLGQLGPIGTKHYLKNTNFVGNACEVARLLASVATRQAFGGDPAGQHDCEDMLQMMKHGPGINGNTSFIGDALEAANPGMGPISGKIGIGEAPRSGASPAGMHDCAIVERTTDHGKKLRYVMAVLGGYDSELDPFDMMVQGLDGCIAS